MKNRKTGIITTMIINTVFIIIPSFILWFFFSKDWINDPYLRYSYVWILAIGFIIAITLLLSFFVWLDWVWYDIFNFSIPCAFLMMSILVTYPLVSWARVLIIIPLIIIVTLPVNMISAKIGERRTKSYQSDIELINSLGEK